MSNAWITGLSLVVVNLLVLAGVIYTSRQNRHAAAESTEVARDTLKVKEREQLVTHLSEQLERLWPRLEKMDARDAEKAERIDQLERENGDLRQHTVRCEQGVEELRERIDDYAHRYGVAVRYVKELHDWMTEHLPGDLRPPEPPEGLAFDLADPMHADPQAAPPAGWPPRAPGPSRRTVGP